MNGRARQRGYVLVTVMVISFLVAAVAFLMNHESAMSTNMAAADLEHDEARYVAEAGIQHALWRTNQANCNNYAGLTNQPFGDHSYTIVVAPISGSPVSLQSTGNLASGALRLTVRENAPVYDLASPMTGTLIPGPEGKDAFIEGDPGHQGHNKGGDSELWISSLTGKELRSLLQFDLSGLPPTAKVQSATVELYLKTFGSSDVVEAHRVRRNWTEDGVTWNVHDGISSWSTPGGDYDADIAGSFLADGVGPKSMDITDTAKAWVEGSLPNYGLILLSPANAGGDTNKFHSSDQSNEPHPRLTLTYVCECGTPCPGITVGKTVVLSADSDAVLGGLNFTDVDLAEYNPASDATALLFEGGLTTLDKDIDAVHVMENGHIVLSTKDDATLGGLSFEDADLVEYDPMTDTATMYFDGSEHFADPDEDIVSVHILNNGNLILSADSEAILGGVSFSDRDLIKYNPINNKASIYFDGDATTLSQDITAVHVLENGHIVMAAKGDTTLGGLSFTTADLIEYDRAADTAILYFAGNSLFDDAGEKIISAHINGDSGPAGELLLVVGNAGSPVTKDTERRDLFESWGYTVTLIDDGTSQANFDAATAANDVIYVSGTISDSALGNKITASPTPIVNEDAFMIVDFGFSSHTYDVTPYNKALFSDPEHYISEAYAGGEITLFALNVATTSPYGAVSDDMQNPAAITPVISLVSTLEAGAQEWDSTPVPARRAQVPFENADVTQVTPDGLTLWRRSLEWAAMPPVGLGPKNVLFVVGNDASLSAEESAHQTLIESWGHTVEFIDDSASQGEFDTAVANNDVVYITNDITASTLSTKLVNATIGVVTSEDNLSDEFGLSDGILWSSTTDIEIVENSHYITSPFSLGMLPIFTASQSYAYLTPSFAPDLLELGSLISRPGLVALESGASAIAGRTAAGRRVQLPWGGSPSLEPSDLTADGLTILQRALEWGAGAGGAAMGPIAHWKLNDGTGTLAVDSEGGHDGTLTNGPVWVAGQLGDALEFDGSNDYVDLTSDAELDDVFDGGATVMAWIYPTGWGENGYGRVFDKSSSASSTGDGWVLRMNTDNGGIINFGQGFTSGRGWWKIPNGSISLNAWQHIAVAYDASSTANDPVIYLAGSPVAVTRVDSPSGSIRSDAAINLRLGNFAGGTSHTFDGTIDDARIYDRMLDASEISEIAAPSAPLPIAHWKLDDGSGTTAIDSEGGHDGTLINGPAWVAGQIGDALDFDGSNDLVSVPHQAIFTQVPMTVSAWFKLDTLPTTRSEHGTIIDKRHTVDPYASWTLYVNEALGNKIRFQIRDSSETGYWLDSAASAVTNTWYHVVGTIDESYNAKLYVNGALEPDEDNIGSLFSSNDEIRIGAGWSGGNRLDGVVDDVRFYDRALSATEISGLYTAGTGGGGGGGGGGCSGPFTDTFDAVSYSGGSTNWKTDWQETGETNDPAGGDIRINDDVSNFQLQVRDDGQTVWRELDLSAATSATLSFDYRRQGLNGSSDYVAVEVSYDGGSNWSELDRFIGTATDSSYLPYSKALDSNSLSDSTRIRFLTPNSGMGNNNIVWFDNVEITCAP